METQAKSLIVERMRKMTNAIGSLFRLVPVDEGDEGNDGNLTQQGNDGNDGNDGNLTPPDEPATLEPATAAGETAEETGVPADGYKSIIEQQNQLIASMKEQNERLNGQIVELMKSGAQIRDDGSAGASQTPPVPKRDEDAPSLGDLGKMVGRKAERQ